MKECITTEEKAIIKRQIWKIEEEIEDFKKESIHYKVMYDDAIKQISDRKEILKTLNKIIEEDKKEKEKTVKDILTDLVDEENSRFYLLEEISKIRREKLNKEDQKDFDEAINFLKALTDENNKIQKENNNDKNN